MSRKSEPILLVQKPKRKKRGGKTLRRKMSFCFDLNSICLVGVKVFAKVRIGNHVMGGIPKLGSHNLFCLNILTNIFRTDLNKRIKIRK